MSLNVKDARGVIVMTFDRIARAVKKADPKDPAATLKEIEQYLMLARLVLEEPKKKTGKPAKKSASSKKRKAEGEPDADAEVTSEDPPADPSR